MTDQSSSTAAALLPCVEHEPTQTATHAVIWLHGLGADGNDFMPIVPELGLPDDLPIRFVFPHAPSMPVTVNGGVTMPAWYDILDIQIDRKVDETQLRQSAQAAHRLIDREIERGIPAERIILAGFSQGGAVAYEAALTYPQKLAGLMALSTYFATADSVVLSEASQGLPILVNHGTQDPVVPESLGRAAVDRLQTLGFKPQYKSYTMPHAVSPDQIRDIGQWLQQHLR